MAKVIAGETVTFTIDNKTVTAKVEDASKSEYILAKVQTSTSSAHKVGNVYEFERSQLTDS